jgi:hypothetical protein
MNPLHVSYAAEVAPHPVRKRSPVTREKADVPWVIYVQSGAMNKVNWSRVFGCGLVAGIVWIMLGSLVTALLGRDFAALPNNRLAKPTPGFMLFNVMLDLMEGISIVWLYAVLRPVYGLGVRTAVIAAFAWWLIVSLGDATWCSFGFFPPRTVIPLLIGTLPALVLATVAGTKFYRE